MALEFAAIAIVTAMMTWVIQVENGGLLNVLFDKIPSVLQDSPQFEFTTRIKYDFFTSMLLLKPLPLPILNSMPEALGGGQAGVDNAHAHPNRESVIFWITVALLLFSVVLLMWIPIFSCCCCKSKTKTTAAPAKSRRKRLVFRITFITMMVIELLFVAASVFILVIYLCSMESVVSYLKARPLASPKLTHVPTSLPDGLQAVLMHTTDFFQEGIESGRVHTDTAVKTFINHTKERLANELDKSIDGLLLSLKVKEVLNASNNAFSVYEVFDLHAQDVIQNMGSIQSSARNLSTMLNASMKLIDRALGNYSHCEATPPCSELKNATARPVGPVDLESLNVTVVEQVMRVLNNTIAQLHTLLNQVNSIIDAMHSSTSDILLTLEKEINFDQVFVSLDTFWTNVGGQANDIVHRLQLAANSFEKQLEDASGPIKITLYCVGGCLTFIILTAAIVNICIIYHVTRNHFSADPGKSSKEDRTEKIVCGRCSICCWSTLLLPILFVFGAVITVSLFALTVASGEGCMYLMRETATNKTDFVLNGYVAHHWDSLIRGVSSDAAEFVITTPPKNPLFALTKTCNTKTSHRRVGLLSALGYSNMVNTSRIVSSPTVAQGIAKGREIVLQELGKMDISGTLPDVTPIVQAKTELVNAAENLSLTLFLDLLDPASINTTEVIHLMDMLKVLVESNQTSNKDDFQVAIDSLGEAVKIINEVKILANKTRESIRSIDECKKGLIASFDAATTALLDSIEFGRNESALMAEVEKQYDALAVGLTEFVEADGDSLFAQLTQDLLPCHKAHVAYTVAMEVTCGESGGVTRLLGLVCVLAFNIVILVLLHFGIFSLVHLQTLQARFLAGEAASRVGLSDEETSATTTTTSGYND